MDSSPKKIIIKDYLEPSDDEERNNRKLSTMTINE
jgi:hypothetical protein